MKSLFDRFASMFRAPSMTEIIDHELTEATLEAEQAKAVIHNHEFQLHMARARIAALVAWNEGHP